MQIKSISLSSCDQTMKGGSGSWWENDEEIKDNDVVVGADVDNVVERENRVSGVSPIMVKPGKRFPVRLKDLLATGILEGLKVKYVKGHKALKRGEKELQGVIKDSGILCFCGSCKGNQVVSPTVFELHAGSGNKHAPEYTYLENGKLLRDVMNACSSLPLDTLDEVVQMVLGDFTMQKSNICFNCRGSISESNKGESKLVCNPCMELKETQTSQLQTAATCSKRITQVVQPSQKMEEDDKIKASGKMISSTTDHHQKEGDDVAMNDSTFSLQLASSINRTPKKRKEGPETETTSAGTSSKKRRGCALGFGSKNKREEGPSEKATSAETSSQKRKGRPPGSGGGRFTLHMMNLNAGQDLVDAIYNLSEAIPGHSVIIHSATGSVSEVGLLDPNGPLNKRQGKFQILTLVVKCLVDDDGLPCRANVRCRVILTDDKGITFGSTAVNSLKAAGPVEIVASSFVTNVAKESTARILTAAAARNSNSDSQKVLEELEAPRMLGQSSRLSPTTGLLPPNPPVAGGNINPKTTTTTSTVNDQDMKSPSVEDT